MWTLPFWMETGERSVKTFCQTLSGILVAGPGVGVLLSGGVAGAAGRWMTNRKAIPMQPQLESTETTKTTTVHSRLGKPTKP